MARNICLVTGPIVGLRSTRFLEDSVEFASQLGRPLVVFNVFDEVLEQAGARVDNGYQYIRTVGEILDGYQYQFKLMREKAYLSIGRKIDSLPKNTSVVVRTPATIAWRGLNIEFKDHRIIAETIRPDCIVTLIDAEWKIQERLKTQYGQHVLKVVAHQKDVSLGRILDWLGAEVSRSEDWAEWIQQESGRKVRHYVLGIETPSRKNRTSYVPDVDNMVKFATESNLTSFYASYSMTVADEEVRRAINGLIWQLRGYGAVIDPASIEIGQNVGPADEQVVFAYTVCRDLRWDVCKVDIVSAFHPYPKVPPLSTGMMDELGHARAFRKERYLVMPTGAGSPFTKDNYIPAEHLFKDGKAFFRHLETRKGGPLKPRFADMVAAFGAWQEKTVTKRRARRR